MENIENKELKILSPALRMEYSNLFDKLDIGFSYGGSLRDEKFKMVAVAAFLRCYSHICEDEFFNMQVILMTMCKIRGIKYSLMPDFPTSVLGLKISTGIYSDYEYVKRVFLEEKSWKLFYDFLLQKYFLLGPYSDVDLCKKGRYYDPN